MCVCARALFSVLFFLAFNKPDFNAWLFVCLCVCAASLVHSLIESLFYFCFFVWLNRNIGCSGRANGGRSGRLTQADNAIAWRLCGARARR